MTEKFKYLMIGAALAGATGLAHAVSRTYEFYPEVPQVVENPLFWNLDTNCSISTVDASDSLTGLMIKKSGAINGEKLSEGQWKDLTVHNGDNLHIQADVNAKLRITNHGNSMVKAECKL